MSVRSTYPGHFFSGEFTAERKRHAQEAPLVSLRKPPAVVNLARAEQLVRKAEEPKDGQASRVLNAKTPERSGVLNV